MTSYIKSESDTEFSSDWDLVLDNLIHGFVPDPKFGFLHIKPIFQFYTIPKSVRFLVIWVEFITAYDSTRCSEYCVDNEFSYL